MIVSHVFVFRDAITFLFHSFCAVRFSEMDVSNVRMPRIMIIVSVERIFAILKIQI